MDEYLSQRLVKARSGHGWSQADLAEVSGVAAAQISRYEAGRSKPRAEVVAKLAKALAVSFDWLREGIGHAEIGAEVPKYPVSQSAVMSLEIDAEMQEALEKIAERNGMTVEMVFKQMIRLAMNEIGGDPLRMAEALRGLREGTEKIPREP